MSVDTQPTDGSTRYRRRTESTSFIETSGGLLTEQLVRKLRERDCGESAVDPATFVPPDEDPLTESELEDRIGETWEELRERWDEVTQDNELFGMDVSAARNRWILKLLEGLGFDPSYIKSHLEADGVTADLSHYGWPHPENISSFGAMGGAIPPVIHNVQPGSRGPDSKDIELDDGDHPGAEGRQRSPHDELQAYLNASDEQQWGIVTDGLKLRILRDYYHTYTRGYVEFDLENIFTNRNYGDFRALCRLCHVSRFIPRETDEEDAEIPLEQLYQVALATGVKVGQDLQSNVVSAIETLGNGFLNQKIREELKEGGQDATENYYQDILYVIYRLLFLMFAEQRGMMSDRDSLYTEEYSVTKLRDRAEQREHDDRNSDLWEGLKATFELVGEGDTDLGVPGYNGGLFDDDNIEYILDSECPNDKLLNAVDGLTHVEQEGYRQRISYADIGVEEIGAVYESLLEFTPQIADTIVELDDRTISPNTFYLDDRGVERKETGSYYTDPGLVNELIKSTLKPVIDDRVNEDAAIETQEQQLLDISVCDPACGSGAFLIAANNYLGQRLAEIRKASLYPDEETIRQARRSVVQHCIFGADINPMAVELAKVSLWINSAVENKPLNFLNHHIRCGNSLIGTNQELLNDEFPVDAYDTSGGRDWHVGNKIRSRIRDENKERNRARGNTSLDDWGAGEEEYLDLAERLIELDEENSEDIYKKQELHQDLLQSEVYKRNKCIFDVWTAAFYWPMDGSASEYPSPKTIEKLRRNPNPEDRALKDLKERAQQIAKEEKFFHWELEFPHVFNGGDGGFDVVIGNPPWERPKISQKEWFTGRNEEIAALDSKSKRESKIDELSEKNSQLYEEWKKALKRVDQMTKFLRKSGKYPLSGRGDVNTYPLFTELAADEIVCRTGHVGLIVKTGIATDYHTRHLFAHFIEDDRLVSLHDFENKKGLFSDVERNERFCLLTLVGPGLESDGGEFSFHNQDIEETNDDDNTYGLTPEQISQINPNTKTAPTFKSTQARDIAIKIYENFPVLINEEEDQNPWGFKYHRMLDMANDSDLFHNNTLEDLKEKGFELTSGNIFVRDDERYLPMYEGKLINQFDHRFGTFDEVNPEKRFNRKAQTIKLTAEEKKDHSLETIPRYWVSESDFIDVKNEIGWDEGWIFAFRDIARSHTDYRTAIATLTPFYPHGHTIPVLTFDLENPAQKAVQFTTVFTSFVFDFALRQSIGGAHLTLYILKQLPMPTPEQIRQYKVNLASSEVELEEFLISRGLQLIWTSHSLDSLGAEFDIQDSPTVWDTDERRRMRVEIEAAIAQMYGLTRGEFECILDDFHILRKQEIDKFGEFRMKEECLNIFDRIDVYQKY